MLGLFPSPTRLRGLGSTVLGLTLEEEEEEEDEDEEEMEEEAVEADETTGPYTSSF